MKAGKSRTEKTGHKIESTVAEFNKYRSPEATAKLVSLKGKEFRIDFSGHFCVTCGFHDYFDDFRIFLEDAGLKSKIGKIEERDDGALVMFKFQPS